jgi:zinc finger protein ZFPM1
LRLIYKIINIYFSHHSVIKTEPEDVEMEEEAPKESEESCKSPIVASTPIKIETEEDIEITDSPKHSPPPQRLVSPKTTSPGSNHSPTISINSTTPPIVSPNGSKYCTNCDISFTYTNTFIAHKKFYCKGKNGDRTMTNSPNPSNVVNVTLAAETSVL